MNPDRVAAREVRLSTKKALEEVMKKYSQPGKADWGSLVGVLRINKDPVWLQRHAWDEPD